MTCLVLSSEGVAFNAVQKPSFNWYLQSVDGHVLCGYRGNEYEFSSKNSAKQWLRDSRSKASYGKRTSPEQIKRIRKIQFEILQPFLEIELNMIEQRNNGLKVVTAMDDLSDCDCENEPMDGGNAFSIYQ